jgi:ribonucleoside-diphosphate reductase alpha chain
MEAQEMQVTKRNGHIEVLSFDKILKRVKKAGNEIQPPLTRVKYSELVMKVIDQLYHLIPTSVIDELTAEQCASMSTKHVEYALLANRIIVSNHHKNTKGSFSVVMKQLYKCQSVHGDHRPIISEYMWKLIQKNSKMYDEMIDYERDYLFDYFGFKTLERAYLLKVYDVIVERPQHMWLRVALGIHGDNTIMVKQIYDLMSQKYFTHATPTLFNAGTPRPQLSSCFLLAMAEDSIEGIFSTLTNCALVSKWAGGIGLHVHNIRATGSHIHGTNGTSNGLVPMLRVFNSTARYVDQGGGKRSGSFAVYLEPWHADIEDFLLLKRNHGDEDMRARDLFYALWIPDLFMEKVKEDADWALFCPFKCPGLADCYGDAFRTLYEKYVSEGKANKVLKARTLWYKILDSQMETGTPYMLYKDAANKKSNQQNLGVIKSSNLCTEIIEYSNAEETAVCNLASIALNKFVTQSQSSAGVPFFNFEELHRVTKLVTASLNKVIDVNFYPTFQAATSNKAHRPLGIGVQGLADTFALMDIAFHSEEALALNKRIFETMYHAALEMSNEIAKTNKNGCESAYDSFSGSPASEGKLQYDLWGAAATHETTNYDWPKLKESIKTFGLRNSLLLAPMPTATTSQILGNNECFEPFTSNIYTRRTNAGEFILVNKYLMQELDALGLWSEAVKNNIILNKGSVQQLEGLAQHVKDKYKIVWEIPAKHLIDMAVTRAPYICQSQSMNLWVEDPDYKSLTSMHFYAWQQGLKTGLYYLRRKPKHQPQQFTIAPTPTTPTTTTPTTTNANYNNVECEMCSA